MALVLADRVKETTTTAGTGTVTLLGASPGFQSFAVVGNANTTYYTIAGQTTSEWEVGIGTYTSSGTTLARTTVLSNSAGTQPTALTFSAGTKDVFVTYPSSKSVNQDASGNVGIGTSSPTSKLTVDGTANVTGNVTLGDAATDTVRVNGYMGVGVAAAPSISVYASSTELTTTNQRGFQSSVFGTSAATVKIAGYWSNIGTEATAFTCADVINFYALDAIKGAGSTITNQHGVYISDQIQGTNNYGITSLVSSGTNKFNIYASGTAGNYFAGNVGIGTTTPTTKLDVTGTVTATNVNMGFTSTATAAGTTTLTASSTHYQRFTGVTTQTIALPVTSTLVVGVAYEIENASTGNLTVNSSGGNLVVTVIPGVTVQCMCIGTTLTTAADWDPEYNEFAAITGTGAVVLATSPTLVTPLLGTPTSGNLANCTFPTLNQNTTGSAATFTSTSQNSQFNSVGVGTAGSGTAGEIRATNNVTAFYSSDIKFKENVRNIPDALATVNAIGGKLFDWTDAYVESKGGADGYFVQKADFGVIAQDVQKVFPIAVRTREDGSLAVDYEKLGVLAFAALVEITKRVEALEDK